MNCSQEMLSQKAIQEQMKKDGTDACMWLSLEKIQGNNPKSFSEYLPALPGRRL